MPGNRKNRMIAGARIAGFPGKIKGPDIEAVGWLSSRTRRSAVDPPVAVDQLEKAPLVIVAVKSVVKQRVEDDGLEQLPVGRRPGLVERTKARDAPAFQARLVE